MYYALIDVQTTVLSVDGLVHMDGIDMYCLMVLTVVQLQQHEAVPPAVLFCFGRVCARFSI